MKPQEELTPDPMSDVFTAMLWSSPKNEHLLRSFINAVRTDAGMTSIVQATVQNPFNIKDFVASKRIVLDVRVKDEHEHLYDIEVQGADHAAFSNRVVEYSADTFVGQFKSGMNYTALRPVMSIILTAFPIFRQLTRLHTIFEIRSRENPDVLLTSHLHFHFLRLWDVFQGHLEKLDDLCRDLRDWVLFFVFAAVKTEREMSQLTDHNPVILEAFEEMQRFFADPETCELARERRQFIFDFNLGMNASKEEGIAEGEAKGKADSIVYNLKRRFGTVSHELESRLLAITDVAQLDCLRDLSYDCDSLEEFKTGLA